MNRALHLTAMRSVDITLSTRDRRLHASKAYQGEITYEDGQFDFVEAVDQQPDVMDRLRTYPRNPEIRKTQHGHLRHNRDAGYYRISFVIPEIDVRDDNFDYVESELDMMLRRLDREISESWGQTP